VVAQQPGRRALALQQQAQQQQARGDGLHPGGAGLLARQLEGQLERGRQLRPAAVQHLAFHRPRQVALHLVQAQPGLVEQLLGGAGRFQDGGQQVFRQDHLGAPRHRPVGGRLEDLLGVVRQRAQQLAGGARHLVAFRQVRRAAFAELVDLVEPLRVAAVLDAGIPLVAAFTEHGDLPGDRSNRRRGRKQADWVC
jgi:hypothetical protein